LKITVKIAAGRQKEVSASPQRFFATHKSDCSRFSFLVLLFGVSFCHLPFLTPNVVFDAAHARLPGAIGAAEKRLFRLNAVTDNFAPAVRANGCKFMYRAFKTIENVAVARRDNFKR